MYNLSHRRIRKLNNLIANIDKLNINGNSRRNRKNKRARLLNKKPVNISTGVQKMGPGTTMLSINDFYAVTNGTDNKNIIKTALEGEEFASRKINYKYFKIIGVKITVFPFSSTTNTMIYMNFKYGENTTMNSNNIMSDDSSKVFASYSTKPKTFRFLPPDITFNHLIVLDQITFTKSYNYNEWNEMSTISYFDSALNVYNSGAASVYIQTEVVVQFRGATFDSAVTHMISLFTKLDEEKKKQLIKAVEGDLLKEDDKEEEEEEKEEDKLRASQNLEKSSNLDRNVGTAKKTKQRK